MALGHKSLAGDSQSGPPLKPTRSHRERLAWYWARTAQMDAKEIVHRVVEGATKQLSRRLTQGWDAIKPAGTLVPLPFAAGALRNCDPALAANNRQRSERYAAGQIPSARRDMACASSHASVPDLLACRSR